MSLFFDRTAIIGVGLLGGSVGLSLKARGICGKVIGVSRSRTSIEIGLRIGAIDEAADEAAEAARDANLVVVSTPVGSVAGVIAEIESSIDDECIITDVGSAKRSIVYEVEKLHRAGSRFVGSHPLAGSEKKGVQHASAKLFEKALVFVTPTSSTDPDAANKIREMWEQFGGKVIDLDPEVHDRVVARTSHLPHIVAALLMAGLRALPEEYSKLVGKGFLDTTRIASSDPEMWADICVSNFEEIREAIAMLRDDLDELEMYLNGEEYEKLFDFFSLMKNLRDSLNQKESNA
ncbi:MAG: prephenate dehydrogenase/arogenate dehydrogenase family protein [Candidatus Lindowbacteria bacterium]|nr:prephenate dehydrogenase/arogenate dehydrogenase family protein [Candidatus Lindowbacteria bacterium]